VSDDRAGGAAAFDIGTGDQELVAATVVLDHGIISCQSIELL